jgi:hypothetical protein
MGAMKDYAIWLQEMGHTEWNEFTQTYEYITSHNSNELWDLYIKERNRKTYTKEKS